MSESGQYLELESIGRRSSSSIASAMEGGLSVSAGVIAHSSYYTEADDEKKNGSNIRKKSGALDHEALLARNTAIENHMNERKESEELMSGYE